MYQVILLPHARKQLRDFVSYHNEFLIENFYDTWLVWEEIIRERYMREWMEFGRALYDNIVEKLSREILWYEEIAWDSRITVTRFGTRRVFLYYREHSDIREVYSLQIFHR